MLRAATRAVKKFITNVQKATTPRGYFYEELVLWDFTKEESLKQWVCICDKDIEGLSTARFEQNRKGTGALFHGELNTRLPVNNKARYSGYCAIRSKPLKASWFEKDSFDLSEYDAFQLRVRGDGRRFMANLGAPGLGRKDDVWQCFVFTRGGPEWENITLPFGDFFVTHRGYMQDNTFSFPRSSVSTFGLLLADKVDGEFELEIQHIKAIRTLFSRPESLIQ